ncbi:hypothetical protein, partial [Arthrobacter sp.]|uniref:hypothetical protein n=1 Tax=Arthrobacter sp. TaxID=1667 RepID=UPI002811C932
MIIRAALSTVVVASVLMFSGCSAPPIESRVAQELQSEVQQIAVLTARGDTADAVAAAHELAARVRTAQMEGKITGERAVMILQRVEQLIERLVRSGAAPAPLDLQPMASPMDPAAPAPKPQPVPEPEPESEPVPTDPTDPTDIPKPAEQPAPFAPIEPADLPEPVVIEPAPEPVDSSGSSGTGSGSGADSGSPNSVPGTAGNSGSGVPGNGTAGNGTAGNG